MTRRSLWMSSEVNHLAHDYPAAADGHVPAKLVILTRATDDEPPAWIFQPTVSS